jgi:hypothetical protein
MNRKQFIILLALVAVIGTAGLIVHQRSNNSWQSAEASIGQKLLPNLAVNDIAQITIQSGTNNLTLAKSDSLWRVRERGDYPANFPQISDLLMKFAGLKIEQSEEIGPSQFGRFQLLPPSPATNTGTLVEFKDQGGKTLSTLLLGKKHMAKAAADSQFGGMDSEGWPDGRYVMVGTDAKSLAVISDTLDEVQPKPEQWLNKDFFSIEKPRSIAVQFPESTNSWKLIRASDTNDWHLADAGSDEKLDSTKISSITSPFGSASFGDVAQPAKSYNPANNTVLTVETLDGFTYVAKIGQKQNENYPVSFSISANLPAERITAKDEKPDQKTRLDNEFKEQQGRLAEKLAREKRFENWIYFLPAYSIDGLLKPREQLLVEKQKEASSQPAK